MLGRLFRSISYTVKKQRTEWSEQNPTRFKYEPSLLKRWFGYACDEPAYVILALSGLSVALTLISAFWLKPPYHARFLFMPNGENYSPDSAFLGLWAVQAALVAVVYPIVIAFITVLLQRQSASKASLQAYFVSSGAKLTGLSSLALVVVIAFQFLMLDSVSPIAAFAWNIGDGIWFLANAFLTWNFLGSTFEFASPEGRIAARNRYLLTIGWPKEWAFHLSRLVAQTPIRQNLLQATDAIGTLEGNIAAFSSTGSHFGGKGALKLNFRGLKSVVDIRYIFLQMAFDSWAKRCSASVSPVSTNAKQGVFHRKGPVLGFAVNLNEPFSSVDAIYRYTNGPAPNIYEKTLLRLSVVLSKRSGAPQVTVADVLDESKFEAIDAINNNSITEFLRRLRELLEIYDQVVESSQTNKAEGINNLTLLPSSYNTWSGHSLVDDWQQVFSDLHSSALFSMSKRSEFAEKTIALPARLFLRQESYLNQALREKYTRLQYHIFNQLLDWGAEECAAAPETENRGKVLLEPLRARYEVTIKSGISAWESIKNWYVATPDSEAWSWEQMSAIAPTFQLHILYTCQLVAHAMRNNDERAFYWLTNSLLKWHAQLQYNGYSGGVAWQDRYKVSYVHLLRTYNDFRALFPLPDFESEGGGMMQDVWNLALRNLWQDSVLTLAASWVKQSSSNTALLDLTAALIDACLLNKSPPEDLSVNDSCLLANSPNELLYSLIRQQISDGEGQSAYATQLEKLADAVATAPWENGIVGRVYSGVGTEFDAIKEGHVFMLACLATDEWAPAFQLGNEIASWSTYDLRRRHLRSYLEDLSSCALDTDISQKFFPLWKKIGNEDQNVLTRRLTKVGYSLHAVVEKIDEIRSEHISNLEPSPTALKRLAELSLRTLQTASTLPPLCFFDNLEISPSELRPAVGTERFVRIRGWEKGSITEPRMTPPLLNEEGILSDAIGQALIFEVMLDFILCMEIEIKGVSSLKSFLEEIDGYSIKAIKDNKTPILLVPSRTDPSWLVDLSRGTGEGNIQVPQIKRLSTHINLKNYVGHIGDTAVYFSRGIRGESILCALESFKGLSVSTDGNDASCVAAEKEQDPHRVTLVIKWNQKSTFEHGQIIRLYQAGA